MSNTKTRATKGGELGINGDWYKGGEFLPSTPEYPRGYFKNAKAKRGAMKIGKDEIAPRKWEMQPAHNMRSLWRMINHVADENGNVTASEETLAYFNIDVEKLNTYATAYANGQRWIECEVLANGQKPYPSMS